MDDVLLHKDGKKVYCDIETIMEFNSCSKATAIWWMTNTSRDRNTAKDEIVQLLKIPDHPDREFIEACATFLIKERLTS